MKCQKCGTENPHHKRFCGECGGELERVCPNCNSMNPPQFKYCGECGHALTGSLKTTLQQFSFDEKLTKIQKYLPSGLAQKILAQKGKIEGERKQVTVMFCDMEGFTPFVERLGPEESYSIMDQVFEILIHKVHDYEGTVNKMTGDGIMALFGAPIALEDAPQRAIRSAGCMPRGVLHNPHPFKGGHFMSPDQLYFNGINGATGGYLLPPMTPQDISRIAQGEPLDEAHLQELKSRYERSTQKFLGPKEGVDPKNLSESGWGVIFAYEDKDRVPALKEALQELLNLRRTQAGQYYREFGGVDAYRPAESKSAFLVRHGVGPAEPADPEKVPYYLLIVADPEKIPYRFQYQLDVQYAVGRICFSTLDEYARYARSVVMAETGKVVLPRRATFFGVQNADDPATALSATELVAPLYKAMAKDQKNKWQIDLVPPDKAVKSRLQELLGGAETPALLFTASHGMGFPMDDKRQLSDQGGLLCGDWPGPLDWRGEIPNRFYLTGNEDDIGNDAQLLGLLTFHFACYGAGTPRLDDFAHRTSKQPAAIAAKAFAAKLPQRLLGHPKGGALAVIGHVERAWGYSFTWQGAGRQLVVFESTLKRLMEGHPVGSAVEYFNDKYAALSTVLSAELEEVKFGKIPNDVELAGMWTANNDARSYVIFGDPAVRLPVGEAAPAGAKRPVMEAITLQSPTAPVQQAPASPIAESAAVEYGLLDPLKQAQARLTDSIQEFASKLGECLKKAVDDASSLEIRTYVSENMAGVEYDSATGNFTGAAKLRALTRIKADGDTLVCVPEEGGEINKTLWEIHAGMVEKAQAHRAEMLKAVVSAAAGLLKLV